MAAGVDKSWINLERVSLLLVDDSALGVDILRQLFAGFGVRHAMRCSSAEEAQELIKTTEFDLIVSNDILPDMSGYDLIHWLRRAGLEPNSFTPAIIVSSHTRRSDVGRARDCGANFVIAKPISTRVLLERVMWVAREKRPFVDAGDYIGPERRFHDEGVPKSGGRRRGDPAKETDTEAAEPAVHQSGLRFAS